MIFSLPGFACFAAVMFVFAHAFARLTVGIGWLWLSLLAMTTAPLRQNRAGVVDQAELVERSARVQAGEHPGLSTTLPAWPS